MTFYVIAASSIGAVFGMCWGGVIQRTWVVGQRLSQSRKLMVYLIGFLPFTALWFKWTVGLAQIGVYAPACAAVVFVPMGWFGAKGWRSVRESTHETR